MEVYLVRHGETVWNQERRYQGQQDIPLTAAGRAQAEALGAWLTRSGIDFEGLWSSDLARAHDTAAVLARHLRLPVQDDPRLREMHYGEWEGLTLAEVERRFRRQLQAYHEDGQLIRVPGGESLQDLADRSLAVLSEIYESGLKRVLVVTHGGTTRTMICALLGIDLRLRGAFALDNTGLSIVELNHSPYNPERRPRLKLLNQTCHLETLPT